MSEKKKEGEYYNLTSHTVNSTAIQEKHNTYQISSSLYMDMHGFERLSP